MNKIVLFFAAVLILSTAPTTAFAAVDRAFNIKNDIFFSTSGSACGVSQDIISVGVNGSNGNKLASILNFFTGQGLTLAAAAGFAGNMQQESNLNPAIIQGGAIADEGYKPVNGVGFGLVQWTFGGISGPRQQGLYLLAQNTNRSITDINVQLEYVWKELNAGYKTSTLDQLQGISDPVEAAIIVHDNYEISADSDAEVRSVRGGNAQEYFNQYKGKIVDGTGATVNAVAATSQDGTTSCTVQDTSTGGLGVAGNFTFPLKTTKAALAIGSENDQGTGIWNPSCKTGCHHDYDAADIFDQTGVPIVAAVGGNVVKGGEDASCGSSGCNVSIKGDDGILYFYQHMSKAATVNKGATVSAGDVIGAVGTNYSALGTARHLHFDMLPEKYTARPSCSGAACSSYPFINPMEFLEPAYEALPEGALRV